MKAFGCAAVLIVGTICWGQFLPSLQADSKEEFDDYLTVETSGTPKEIVERSAAFLQRWPQSLLAPRIHEMRFFAFRDDGDPRRAKVAAEEALRAAPDNLMVKAALAAMIAPEDPTKAMSLAQESLRAIGSFRVPRSIPQERWSKLAGGIRAEAHMAIGVVQFGQGDTPGAIASLESAERSAPTPHAAICLRLGRLYAAVGRIADARLQFERAAQAGDQNAAALARRELDALQ